MDIQEVRSHPDMGKKAKCLITGFKGTIIGFCEHITGCDTFCLQPKIDKGKHVDARWFDSNRLQVMKGKKLTMKAEVLTGACCEEPQL